MGTTHIPLHLFSHLSTPHHTTSTTMPARDTGAKIGDKLDAVTKQSYHELGYKMGERVDQTLTELNEKLRDPTGKTPEDHFKDIYGASASLIGHTYDYAWSWVPFTKQKARNAKQQVKGSAHYATHTSAHGVKEDAKSKAGDVKNDVMETELPGPTQQTIGGLINEARGLVGQVLDTIIYYVKVAEKKGEEAVHDPKGVAHQAKNKAILQGDTVIDQARNVSAFVMEKSRDIITYGVEKKDEAKDQLYQGAGEAKDQMRRGAGEAKEYAQKNAGEARDRAAAETGTRNDRPHVAVSAQL